MTAIEIIVEGYGAIERKLPPQLVLHYSDEILVSDVLTEVIQKYPDAQKAIERCACAMGEDIISRQTKLTHPCTLVLLSPVAGG